MPSPEFTRTGIRTPVLAVMLLAGASAGCDGIIDSANGISRDNPNDPGDSGFVDDTRAELASCDSFEPAQPYVYATKAKTLLTGLGLTAAELDAITANPQSLRQHIETWLDMPEADSKLQRFFQTAFQQDGYEEQALTDLWGYDNIRAGRLADGTSGEDVLVRSFEESFARTVVDIVKSNRPFNEAVTTRTIHLTTAQKIALVLSDDREINDDFDRRYNRAREMITQIEYTTADVPLSETLDPSSPNWMRFAIPDEGLPGGCNGNAVKTNGDLVRTALEAIFGFYADNDGCMENNYRGAPLIGDAAFFDWHPVTFRTPAANEEPTMFWDLDTIQNSDQLVLRVPRVGFMTTPAFFATWPTNDANEARVTINQTLIVALGKSFDNETTVIPSFDDALDDSHADPTTACWNCHVNLDPMRQYFRNSFTYSYHVQQDDEVKALRPAFAFQGVETGGASGDGIDKLSETLSDHPRFAPAWVQQTCFFATSSECPEDSAEFQRVVGAFQNSGMQFRSMLVELLSSSLVSGETCVEKGSGDIPSVARARHFCSTVSNRLGVTDVCGTDTYYQSERRGPRGVTRQLIEVVPDDAFSRGSERPIVITDSNLFIRASADAICQRIGELVVNNDGKYPPSAPLPAIQSFVNDLMGLPTSDPRHDGAVDILVRHFAAADVDESTTNALRSTFMIACTSPSVLGMGL